MAEPDSSNPAEGSTPPPTPASSAADAMAQEALRAAQEAIASLTSDVSTALPAAAPEEAEPEPATESTQAAPFELPVFASNGDSGQTKGIDLLSDVNLNVKIELGRTRMFVEDVLKLSEGAIVELDKLAGDPVDIFVNDRPIARGEVLVLNDNFCVRINEILQAGAEDRAAG